jgi:hypothetical protein
MTLPATVEQAKAELVRNVEELTQRLKAAVSKQEMADIVGHGLGFFGACIHVSGLGDARDLLNVALAAADEMAGHAPGPDLMKEPYPPDDDDHLHQDIEEDCLGCALARCAVENDLQKVNLSAYKARNPDETVIAMQVVATGRAEIESLQRWHAENKMGEQ